MHKQFKVMSALVLGLFAMPVVGSSVFAQDASNIDDGEYDVGVTSYEDGSNEVSVADDFVHDASITIEGGDPSLTLGIGAGGGDYSDFDFNIEWVNVDGQKPASESEQGEYTYYTFPLSSLEANVPAQMEYVVPDFPALEDGHEVAFNIQLDGLDDLPVTETSSNNNENSDNNGDSQNAESTNDDDGSSGSDSDNDSNNAAASNGNDDSNDNNSENDGASDNDDEATDNPKTGDNTNVMLYSLLLIAAAVPLAFIVKRRFL